jgi:phage gpG-like protein
VGRRVGFSVKVEGMGSLLAELSTYGDEVEKLQVEMLTAIAERGERIARRELRKAGISPGGTLGQSITSEYDEQRKLGVVKTDCPYAGFVEFGTGIVGKGSPHPEAGTHGWKYDINEHGEKGWVYYDRKRGKFFWTKGRPSVPFMYLTAQELKQMAPKIAAEVLRDHRH